MVEDRSQYLTLYLKLRCPKKGIILKMISKFELDLYLMVFHPSVKFEYSVASLQKLLITDKTCDSTGSNDVTHCLNSVVSL